MNKPTLMRTKNYGIFDTHEFNRPLHDDPVLLASMKKYGFMKGCPLQVCRNGNKKFKVIQGHHRLHYAKMLNIEVYFVIEDKQPDLFEVAGVKEKWSIPDFVKARAKAGDKECAYVLEFQRAHGLPMGVAIALVSGRINENGKAIRQIERGEFRRGDMKTAFAVVQITDRCFEKGVAFARSKAFTTALAMMLAVPEFDRAQFLHNIDRAGHRLEKRSTCPEYLDEIEALYYYGSRVLRRDALALRAKQIAHEKALTFGGTRKRRAVKAA